MSHHHSSQTNSSQGLMMKSNLPLPQSSGLCPQQETTLSKNRPQTSFRMATKNTFQMMGERQASGSNLHGAHS
jgi:hypothetical protein